MKKRLMLLMALLILSTVAAPASGGKTILKFGPVFRFDHFGELSAAGLIGGNVLGLDLALRLASGFELRGSYKSSRNTTAGAHGTYDTFRLDAFAAGLRYKLVRWEAAEPFAGIGLDFYHFGNNFQYFIYPVTSALGPYVQAGSYFHLNRLVDFLAYAQYNLVTHTVKRTSGSKTYHYRTDFSGLEFGIGVLLCLPGK